ncbi:MAG TPA: helix-turn-helix domain-containing protein [Thermoanaerobaculia bacterium]|nr:helix-turn-helix domain-containing protein [Thermoanaerobaculia bacterium]
MLSLEVRKKTGGAEVHRVNLPALTVGASSGNEVVVRARGVAGRHCRIFEREGKYHLDLYKGVEAVNVNGREFTGGPIAVGDRITIGEATLTVLGGRPALRATAVGELPRLDVSTPPTLLTVTTGPMTEVEYRALRLAAYELCRSGRGPDDLAAALVDFLDRELPPSEWAVGQWLNGTFRPLSSTFRETPAIPQKLLGDARAGERLARVDTVTGMFSFVLEPGVSSEEPAAAIFVREDPRLAARALLFLEELVQLASLAMRPFWRGDAGAAAAPPAPSDPMPEEPASALPASETEAILRQTDDLKKIIISVEREVIDRTMRRVEGNQSRGAQVLNISRGSLIAKLKEYGIPDYRYLRRERNRKG